MNNEILMVVLIFIGVNAVNIILSTCKSILTVTGGIWSASLINGATFLVYTYANIITVQSNDLSIHVRAVLIGVLNVLLVAMVKLIEKKLTKDKLWKIESTVPKDEALEVIDKLENSGLPFNYIQGIGKYVVVNIYAETQKESLIAKEILKGTHAKYFASENKPL